MRKFVLTKRARIDIDEIWDYLAADNIEAAERVLTALEAATIRIGKPGA